MYAEPLIKLAYASALAILVMAVSYLRRIEIGRDFSFAALRGFAQLMLLSIVLTYVFTSTIWHIFALPIFIAMALLAGYTSAKRVGMPKATLITTPSIAIGATTSLAAMTVLKVIPLQPKFVIPLAGMAFGNAMNICSLTLNRLLSEVRNNRSRIEAMLALGATAQQAVEQYERTSIKSALIPSIDNMRTLGIIFIPGAMTGMLMAGIDPTTAAVYQISIFFMIISSGIVAAVNATYLTKKRLFTPAHQLAEDV
ncbi:TIGR00245 family protein [Archaeoglobus sulfaticallidus PM70-1]|uniref:TIGR00245 family protein n=2 Tax=Archaeoglobus TaxID=2233 RepID=N0BEY2_9EURY|nr:TIGR00245 family protein [Archaeoglobus sulfaticallidus PM70-1]